MLALAVQLVDLTFAGMVNIAYLFGDLCDWIDAIDVFLIGRMQLCEKAKQSHLCQVLVFGDEADHSGQRILSLDLFCVKTTLLVLLVRLRTIFQSLVVCLAHHESCFLVWGSSCEQRVHLNFFVYLIKIHFKILRVLKLLRRRLQGYFLKVLILQFTFVSWFVFVKVSELLTCAWIWITYCLQCCFFFLTFLWHYYRFCHNICLFESAFDLVLRFFLNAVSICRLFLI